MIVKQAVPGLAFDVDSPLTGAEYAAFKANGYDAVIRYIPRKASLVAGNLTAAEIAAALGAGLALSVVQHVSSGQWDASAELGETYGIYASEYCKSIGLPPGVSVWLDLESVSTTCSADDVIGYANAWYDKVFAAGYQPGIYVGWQVILSGAQLYENLKFSHFWKAYNADVTPAKRGYCIVQHTARTIDGITIDPNTIQPDNLGSLPMFLFPS